MSAIEIDVRPVLAEVNLEGLTDFLVSSVLQVVAEYVMDAIVSQWPVDTGTSLAGFRVRRGAGTWLVVNEVEYTSYVHDGLVFVLAEMAMADAVDLARERADEFRRRQAMQPGTRQVRAMRRRSFGAAPPPSAPGAPPMPRPPDPRVAAALAQGRVADATVLLQAAVRAAPRARVVRAAERLALAGRLPAAILALIKGGRLEEAIARLMREGRRIEAQLLAQSA